MQFSHGLCRAQSSMDRQIFIIPKDRPLPLRTLAVLAIMRPDYFSVHPKKIPSDLHRLSFRFLIAKGGRQRNASRISGNQYSGTQYQTPRFHMLPGTKFTWHKIVYLLSDTSKVPSDLGVSAVQIRDFAQSFVASACFRGHLTQINLPGGDQLTLSCSAHKRAGASVAVGCRLK
jgi:hypothetical protein